MSTSEIEFESVDSENFKVVLEGVTTMANEHLQNRFNAATIATQGFKADAHKVIHESITKPPGEIGVLSAFVDIVSTACEFLIPEEALAAKLIYDGMHSAWEISKTTYEVAEKFKSGTEEHDLEKAREYLDEYADSTAENIVRGANAIIEAGKNAIAPQLEEYVKANPQVFQPHDMGYYETLCAAIGIVRPNVDMLADQMINGAMKKFVPEVEKVAATLHFFHDMGSDQERLDFLIKISEQGTNPDDFLRLIGADQAYWDRVLRYYRANGAEPTYMWLMAGAPDES